MIRKKGRSFVGIQGNIHVKHLDISVIQHGCLS